MASPPGHHWVIGDVHGCHEALLRLISVLPPEDQLVFCGDVINRGPGIAACINLVWELVDSGRATWLRGNHEQRLVEGLQAVSTEGKNDLLAIETYRQLGDALTREWQQRLSTLPFVYYGDGWVATHAGFDKHGHPDLNVREPFWESYDGRYGTVVVGHTPRPAVEQLGQIVMIDTGAVYGGLLTAFCPETEAVVQVIGQPSDKAVPPASHELIAEVPC
ncbi:metallophosphoesterase [Synechococcus sp. UW179A]|uniref:metallophosphoesterase n=1 Tax=Synechococcus sp. UW179A TaxID=2575510 RepID=UPI000E0E5247|nr:metallophosphoesterase [Synechococcus sp. UW179A]